MNGTRKGFQCQKCGALFINEDEAQQCTRSHVPTSEQEIRPVWWFRQSHPQEIVIEWRTITDEGKGVFHRARYKLVEKWEELPQ